MTPINGIALVTIQQLQTNRERQLVCPLMNLIIVKLVVNCVESRTVYYKLRIKKSYQIYVQVYVQ